jgi:molybdenum cofactor cytidylyltransferase
MRKDSKIGVVLLAAGGSTRLGIPKQLVNYEGTTLIEHAVRVFRSGSKGPLAVVLGCHASLLKNLVYSLKLPDVHPVVHSGWEDGMGSSLAFGISQLLGMKRRLSGFLIGLCDQPFLNPTIVRKITTLHKLHDGTIIASRYKGAIGPPVCFPEVFGPRLAACSGDRGARDILYEHHDSLIFLDHPDLALDIDYPEDLENLKFRNQTQETHEHTIDDKR